MFLVLLNPRSSVLNPAFVVPTVRFELTRLAPPPPQDGVSANSTTSAKKTVIRES
jgi:hypothetical protein